MSYILILSQAFLAVLDVRSAIDEGLRGLRCVFLVCNLSTEKVAGLRWVREGIGRIDLPGESLIQRSHNRSSPDKTTYSMSEPQTDLAWFEVFFFRGRSIGFLCASMGNDGRQPVFTSGMEQKDKVKILR